MSQDFPEPAVASSWLRVTRREFMATAGWLTGSAMVPALLKSATAATPKVARPDPVDAVRDILRPADLVNIRVTLVGATFVGSPARGGWSVRTTAGVKPYAVFTLPAQHLLEPRFSPDEEPKGYPVFYAGNSEIAVPLRVTEKPKSYRAIDFLRLLARQPGRSANSSDEPATTRLEIPTGLIITPFRPAVWPNTVRHREFGRAPADEDPFFAELWHAALRLDEPRWRWPFPELSRADWIAKPSDLDPKAIHAAVERGSESAEIAPSGVMVPLGSRAIAFDPPVLNSTHSVYIKRIVDGVRERRAVMRFEHLALTALGANLAFTYRQPLAMADPANPLLEWTQRSFLGRDGHLRILDVGMLLPFQHAAVALEIVYRRFRPKSGAADQRSAILEKRQFVVVIEPTRRFDGSGSDTGNQTVDQAGRHVGFTEVTINTLITPELDVTEGWLHARGTPEGAVVVFDLVGKLPDGGPQVGAMPLYFTTKPLSDSATRDAYNQAPAERRRWKQKPQAAGLVPRASAALATAGAATPQAIGALRAAGRLKRAEDSAWGQKFLTAIKAVEDAVDDKAGVRLAGAVNTFLEASELRLDRLEGALRFRLQALVSTADGRKAAADLLATMAPRLDPATLTARYRDILRVPPTATIALNDLGASLSRDVVAILAAAAGFLQGADGWLHRFEQILDLVLAAAAVPAVPALPNFKVQLRQRGEAYRTKMRDLVALCGRLLHAASPPPDDLGKAIEAVRETAEAFRSLLDPAEDSLRLLPADALSELRALDARIEQVAANLPGRDVAEALRQWSEGATVGFAEAKAWIEGHEQMAAEVLTLAKSDAVFLSECLSLLPLAAAKKRSLVELARTNEAQARVALSRCLVSLNAEILPCLRRRILEQLGISMEDLVPSAMYAEWLSRKRHDLEKVIADCALELRELEGRIAALAGVALDTISASIKAKAQQLKDRCNDAVAELDTLTRPTKMLERRLKQLDREYKDRVMVAQQQLKTELTRLQTELGRAEVAFAEVVQRAREISDRARQPLEEIASSVQRVPVAAPELKISAIDFSLVGLGTDRLASFPSWQQARVVVPEIDAAAEVWLAPVKKFRDEGFLRLQNAGDPLRGAVLDSYARLSEVKQAADDVRAGVTAAQMQFAGLSREIGAVVEKDVNQIAQLAEGKLRDSLQDMLGDVKLLGVLEIQQMIGLGNVLRDMPQAVNRRLVDGHEVRMRWVQPLSEKNFGFIKFTPTRGNASVFVLDNCTRVQLVNGRPVTTVRTEGRLDDPFAIILGGVVTLRFEAVSFLSETGRSTQLRPAFAAKPVQFGGNLEFVAKLEEIFSKFGGLEPPTFERQHIVLNKRIQVPPVTCGALSMTNLSLNIGLGIPLARDPMFYKFSFCSEEEKFLVSVNGFSGAGYLSIAVDSQGRKDIAGALGFGGSLSLNLGVAQGEVAVIAGGAIKLSSATGESAISLFLHAWGRLRVLSIITISIDLFIALTYHSSPTSRVLSGTATLTVRVKVLFASKTVSIRYHQEFAGSKSSSSAALPAAAPGPAASGVPLRPLEIGPPITSYPTSVDAPVSPTPIAAAPAGPAPASALATPQEPRKKFRRFDQPALTAYFTAFAAPHEPTQADN